MIKIGFRMKKILIIGSQGYIGSRLCDYLIDLGFEVSGIDIGLFQYGVIYNPSPFVLTKYKLAAEISENDIEGFDVVVQLASISNDPFGKLEPAKIYDPTRIYTKKIARLCKKLGVRFIFPSSCSVYGLGAETPLDETGVVTPQTPYSINKIEIEEDLCELTDKSFSPIALRLATVFGPSPRIRFDVVVNMLCGMAYTENKILLNSNGMAWRPHVHIDDVCRVIEGCITTNELGNGMLILNVGNNENNCRILDLAEDIAKQISGCEIGFIGQSNHANELMIDRKIQDGVDIRSYKVSFDKLNNLMPKYMPKISIAEGIKDIIKCFDRYKLTIQKFNQIDFYRLQQLEHLHLTNQSLIS
jgi:nucleoside-diphosphate-sugar epimerase